MFRALVGLNGFDGVPIQMRFMLSPVVWAVLLVAGALSLWKWPRFQSIRIFARGTLPYAVVDTAVMSLLFLVCFVLARSSSYSPFLYYRF
ncbi:hypothetical protein [Afipia felis]